MLTVPEALAIVLAQVERPLAPVVRPLTAALGCVLAEEVPADLDLPPFDKALVDGFAVRSADGSGAGTSRRCVGTILAGQAPSRPLGPGEAIEIMTGAPLPPGADAVVMVERTHRQADQVILEGGPVQPGQNVLPRGREMRRGEIVLEPGQVLDATRLGVAASVGRLALKVIPRPRVAIVPTGDELVEPDQVPGPGQIRNSNAALLRALMQQSGAEPDVLPIAADDPRALRSILERGLEADLLLVTGGVSAGRRDLVPAVLADLGIEPRFHKIRLKPGKPLLFGTHPTGRPLVFGLPGNPVSSLVCSLLFVRPAIRALMGQPEGRPHPTRPARLGRPFEHQGDRPTYHPARLQDATSTPPTIEPLSWAGSADLRTLARCDGLAVFPPGDRTYDRGAILEYLPLREA